MSVATPTYAIATTVSGSCETTVPRVVEALQGEGFGVLCQIDVQATLKAKLGIERGKYVIIGACNPPLAKQALEAEPSIGLLLPCNVVVYEAEDGTRVEAVDSAALLGLVGNPALDDVAADVKHRFARVIAGLR
jgi:uncharacterized protein (DUF302 family)